MPGTNAAGLNYRPRMSIEHGQVGAAAGPGSPEAAHLDLARQINADILTALTAEGLIHPPLPPESAPDHVDPDGHTYPELIGELEPTGPRALPKCPECGAGKHRNCDGSTWDYQRDEPGVCPCTCSGTSA